MEPKEKNKYLIIQEFFYNHYLIPMYNRIATGNSMIDKLSPEHLKELDKIKSQYQEFMVFNDCLTELIFATSQNNEFFESMEVMSKIVKSSPIENSTHKFVFDEIFKYTSFKFKQMNDAKEKNLDPKFLNIFNKNV